MHLLDRAVRDIRTGHFERSLSALTAVGAAVTALEIYLEHDRASFGNRMMWVPVALGPTTRWLATGPLQRRDGTAAVRPDADDHGGRHGFAGRSAAP